MRMLMRVSLPVEQGNKAIKDGSLMQAVQSMMQETKPEAAYFGPIDGVRTAFIVFDLKDATDLPMIGEPLFVKLNAKVEFSPVMNADDLKVGLGKVKS